MAERLTANKLAQRVMDYLAHLQPYVYYRAKTGSVYIKFRFEGLRSLRIGDHDGRSKYRYKWNLRRDYPAKQTEEDNGAVRYYYPWAEWEDLCKHIVAYSKRIGGDT